MTVAVVPDTVQTADVVDANATLNPDVAVADKVTVLLGMKVISAGLANAMVCDAVVTVTVTGADVAAA